MNRNIDEAHRGTGNYAYAQVVRYLMHVNPYFRLLALTATPGNTIQKVQEIIDSLHISHIEIRNEQSLDLREYVHEKVCPPLYWCNSNVPVLIVFPLLPGN
jgi:ATP-dependent DNA helicase MPH1